ncbi:single-stranded DNA-binding protein [Streptomyces sp. NPDC058595]|uniref:single-stranded DNA-binding protein n=1 Tax=Streptomyces sp. NPDC058595 TaxID=3346550 RepID=UPI0036696B75
MLGVPTTTVTGTVTGDVEVRFADNGTPIARFRLTVTPQNFNQVTQAWEDAAPVHYMCTLWHDLACHAAESLTDGVTVLVLGRVTHVRDNDLYLSVNDLGLSLRHRIAYTEASLPSPAAARPTPASSPPQPPAAPASAPRPSPATPRSPGQQPDWWARERQTGWHSVAPIPETNSA